jgi:Putative beta barrel porin-7 (BBP7)
MASDTISGLQRRAAVLELLFVCIVAVQAGTVFAQEQTSDGDNLRGRSVIVSDKSSDATHVDSENGADESYGAGNQYRDQEHVSGWFGVEYLRWRLDGSELPPVVTASPATTPINQAGLLDDPSTQILSGDETVGDHWRSGYRIFGGVWLDSRQCWGIGADYFEIGGDGYDFTSPQDPGLIVARPFFNTELGQDDAELVSAPNELDGTVEVRSNDSFRGAGLTLNHTLFCCCDPCCAGSSSKISLLSGYRYYNYDSNLSITENLTVLPGTLTPLVPGTTFFVQDSFRTHNVFNGGEIGLQAYRSRSWLRLDGMAKVAMGSQRRTVTVNGQTTIDVPGGGSFTAPGGLLTSEVTNIGRYEDSAFVFIPEFRLGLGTQVTQSFSLRAGYNLILWGDVARAASHLPPGLQVDPRNLPPIQAGGGPEPEFPGIRGSQLVAHGFDVGGMWQW